MASVLCSRTCARWVLASLLAAAALWMLNIELTYERNIRRGIPADFRIRLHRSVKVWRV